MTRPRTIYVSAHVHAMLKAKAAVDKNFACADELADALLHDRLMQEPYMAEYLRLQKESRDNFERSVAELVKGRR